MGIGISICTLLIHELLGARRYGEDIKLIIIISRIVSVAEPYQLET